MCFFFSSRRRHTRYWRDWSSDGALPISLKKVASYLKSPAGKAAASIPGLIGSVISWLFKAASKVVEILANNVILLVIALIGLLFAVLTSQIRRGTKALKKD